MDIADCEKRKDKCFVYFSIACLILCIINFVQFSPFQSELAILLDKKMQKLGLNTSYSSYFLQHNAGPNDLGPTCLSPEQHIFKKKCSINIDIFLMVHKLHVIF